MDPLLPPHPADASRDADTFALRSYLRAADGRGETVGEMKGGLRRDRSGMRNESEAEDGKVIETLPTVFFCLFFFFAFLLWEGACSNVGIESLPDGHKTFCLSFSCCYCKILC